VFQCCVFQCRVWQCSVFQCCVFQCCHLPWCNARRRCRSLGGVLLLTAIATWRYTVPQAQIKFNVPCSWLFCLTVRSA
jgi:hypothetical protein